MTDGAAPKAGSHDLVIVESPAKAKTINKYLGSGYKVLASYGHVRDLPKRRKKGEVVAGINIEEGWIPTYVVTEREEGKPGRRTAKDILAELKREAAKSNRVFLATDPDREGEAIAWHIEDELGLDPDRTFRVAFNEITRSAVLQAIANPGKIDMDRVHAQEARRILDRVVGYPLSNLLSKKVARRSSAGRVQSVALRLVVDRELEIEAFRTDEYWKLTALLAPEGTVQIASKPFAVVKAKTKGEAAPEPVEKTDKAGEKTPAEPKAALQPGTFLAELAEWNGQKGLEETRETRSYTYPAEEATATRTSPPCWTGHAYTASRKIEQKDRAKKALRQAAVHHQHDPAAGEPAATLHRQPDDAGRPEALRRRRSRQRRLRGAHHLHAYRQHACLERSVNGGARLHRHTVRTGVSAGEAELLRLGQERSGGARGDPADRHGEHAGARRRPRPARRSVTPVHADLQSLRRQPDEARHLRRHQRRGRPKSSASQPQRATGLFKTQGKILKFDGFRRVLAPQSKDDDAMLPALSQGQKLDRLGLTASQHYTQPPPRYNEASLVKALEKEGIGRPSTYASIINKITSEDRGYIEVKERRFYATQIGKIVTDLLTEHFATVMDLKFTSHMEEELDQIEAKKAEYHEVLNEFWGPFSTALKTAEEKMPTKRAVETGEMCPLCGKPLIVNYTPRRLRSQRVHRP